MTATITPTTWQDRWPAYRLENGALSLEVVPDFGGKIVSLRCLATGRSWLWSNPYLPVHPPIAGSSYIRDHDVGGWDEIFPTVHPCRVPDSPWGDDPLNDHGVLWSRAWSSCEPDPAGGEITLRLDLDALRLRFVRTMRLDPDLPFLRLQYVLENLGAASLPYLWAAHPLLALSPGMTICLPPGAIARCTASVGAERPVVGEHFTWPHAPRIGGGSIDLGRLDMLGEAKGRAVKVFIEGAPAAAAWVRLVAPGGEESLQISFRTDEVGHLGLWINEGGWSGAGTPHYRNLGLEPTSSADDDLGAAVARGTAASIAPGETRRWSLDLLLETPHR